MVEHAHIYGEVNSATDLRDVFVDIRNDVDQAHSRPALTELYKRAGYLITLTHAPSWEEKFGKEAATLRRIGKEEFRKTAQKDQSPRAADRHRGGLRRKLGQMTMVKPYHSTESKYKGSAQEIRQSVRQWRNSVPARGRHDPFDTR